MSRFQSPRNRGNISHTEVGAAPIVGARAETPRGEGIVFQSPRNRGNISHVQRVSS